MQVSTLPCQDCLASCMHLRVEFLPPAGEEAAEEEEEARLRADARRHQEELAAELEEGPLWEERCVCFLGIVVFSGLAFGLVLLLLYYATRLLLVGATAFADSDSPRRVPNRIGWL